MKTGQLDNALLGWILALLGLAVAAAVIVMINKGIVKVPLG